VASDDLECHFKVIAVIVSLYEIPRYWFNNTEKNILSVAKLTKQLTKHIVEILSPVAA